MYWYTREQDGAGGEEAAAAARRRELAMVRQREEDLMMEVGASCWCGLFWDLVMGGRWVSSPGAWVAWIVCGALGVL